MTSARPAFTLIELLLVVGIIGILAAVVIVAINPTKQLGDTRNAQRRSDVNTILNAVYQYSIDTRGQLPAGIDTDPKGICLTGAASCENGVDLSVLTLTGTYLVSIPQDPSSTSATGASYNIVRDTSGRVTVTAPLAEQGATISVTR